MKDINITNCVGELSVLTGPVCIESLYDIIKQKIKFVISELKPINKQSIST